MRLLVLAPLVALIGFVPVSDGEREIRISTPTHGVVIDVLDHGEEHRFTLAGPRVTIVLSEGTTLRVNDLDSAGVSAQMDFERDWVTWEGSYEVTLVEDDEVTTRIRVQDATMILGRFEGNEGWTTEGD
ncbi:MAG: hypothetical protein AAGI52_16570 [Bacteroidota bacterium]